MPVFARHRNALRGVALAGVGIFATASLAGVSQVDHGIGSWKALGGFDKLQDLLPYAFFNLLPIPPLDGSHVMRILIGMDYLTYMQIAQYGFILIILILNFVPYVSKLISLASYGTLAVLFRVFGSG